MFFGALLNVEIAHQFTNVPNFDSLGFRKGRVNKAPESYSSEMIGHPNRVTRSALSQHALHIGKVFRCRHLCSLFVRDGIGDRHIVACRERRDFAIKTFNFHSSWPRIWRLTRQFGECFRRIYAPIPYSL